jgi:hypothetical protein
MESVIDTVTDAIADASDLVLDSFSSSSDVVIAGRRGLRRGLIVLILLGAIVGIALWRRSQAAKAEDAAASDRS